MRRTVIAGLFLGCLAGVAGAQSPAGAVHAGNLTIEQPWFRATPGGAKVAAGYLRITNAGAEPDRLTGARAAFAGRGEVHEMAMQDQVMKMRPLPDGLEIGPGQSVELKPGGFHLMFLDVKTGLKEGETIPVVLTFRKAGDVSVPFPVAGLGGHAPTPPKH